MSLLEALNRQAHFYKTPSINEMLFWHSNMFLGGDIMFYGKLYVRTSVMAMSYRVPMIVRQVCRDKDGFFDSLCPRCRRAIAWEYMSFCPGCGQRLCWMFLEEAEELTSPINYAGGDKRRPASVFCAAPSCNR